MTTTLSCHCGAVQFELASARDRHRMPLPVLSRAARRHQCGFNACLLDAAILAAARLRHEDGAVTGKYLD